MFSDIIPRADTAVLLVITAVLGAVVYRLLTRKKLRLPPSPRTWPLLGNMLDFKDTTLTKKSLEWQEQYGPVVMFYSGLRPWVILGSIESLTEAYVQRGNDFANKPMIPSLDLMSMGGRDIAFAPYGPDLKYRRKICFQAMRHYLTGDQHTRRVHQIVAEAVQAMLQEPGPFNPHAHFSLIIFNILHAACFGSTVAMDDPIYQDYLKVFDSESGKVTGYWEDIFPILTHCPTPAFRKAKRGLEAFVAYIHRHISERRSTFDESKMETLVDNILLTERQLRDEDAGGRPDITDVHFSLIISDTFIGGTDTTRNTMDWIFLTLVADAKVQRRVHDEIHRVVGNGVPGKEHRQGLAYTEAVIQEVMRLYPVVPMGLPHETLCDTQVCGFDVPAKTVVVTNVYAIHRDPRHWEHPDSFIPERFIDKDSGALIARPKSWIPFNIGPRNCVGENLGRQNLLYTVVCLLQKLQFSLSPVGEDVDMVPQDTWFTLVPKPYEVVVKPRD
ncbi:unnamed protein product [Lymnaea stagnalis]|uniref:17 alpha-hydroxylase/17,20-lyase n=1 Tax=Lymnaea stagnalis TaxID=6523 RepID=A0A7G7LIE1_LYMST|nr:17 alpha-hydroxylase/17,20-lyase [Lymnaea stagnalis]